MFFKLLSSDSSVDTVITLRFCDEINEFISKVNQETITMQELRIFIYKSKFLLSRTFKFDSVIRASPQPVTIYRYCPTPAVDHYHYLFITINLVTRKRRLLSQDVDVNIQIHLYLNFYVYIFDTPIKKDKVQQDSKPISQQHILHIYIFFCLLVKTTLISFSAGIKFRPRNLL